MMFDFYRERLAPDVFYNKKVFLKIFENLQEKAYVEISFLLNFQAKELHHLRFPGNFKQFLKT